MIKKKLVCGCFLFLLPFFLLVGSVFLTILMISGGSMSNNSDCITPSMDNPADGTTVPQSIDEFVKSHK
ncbi:amidase, partial [Enterococcus canintestini]